MENFVYCTEGEVVDYLRNFGMGRDSRDTELSEAVRLKRLYENSFKKPFLIGIPVTQEGLRQLRSSTISKNEVIKKFRKDDTDVDFLVMDAADCDSNPRDSVDGDVFQMKRITNHQFYNDFNTTVIQELRKIFAKGYTLSPYLSLYLTINLAPQVHTPNWQELTEFCACNNVPFVRIIIGPIKDTAGNELLIEIFPRLRTVQL